MGPEDKKAGVSTMNHKMKAKATTTVTDWAVLRPPVTEELLADITRRIVEKFQPYKVVLFGSYAYGVPNLDSDVDLFVVMDSNELMAQRIRRVSEVAKVRFLPMDVLVYTPAEIEKRLAIGDFFIIEILTKGKVLYQNMTLVDEWVEKAEADYQAAIALNRRRTSPLLDVVCYHCQQCVEKYLKAYLIARGIVPPRTHDLEELLNLGVPHDATLATQLSLVQALNPYGVEIRYPGTSATVAEAKNVVKTMRRLRTVLRRKLGL